MNLAAGSSVGANEFAARAPSAEIIPEMIRMSSGMMRKLISTQPAVMTFERAARMTMSVIIAVTICDQVWANSRSAWWFEVALKKETCAFRSGFDLSTGSSAKLAFVTTERINVRSKSNVRRIRKIQRSAKEGWKKQYFPE